MHDDAPQPRELDLTALTVPVERSAVHAEGESLRAAGRLPTWRDDLVTNLRVLIGSAAAGTLWVIALVALVAEARAAGWSPYFALVLAALVAVAVWGLCTLSAMVIRIRSAPARTFRLQSFARANGGGYTASVRNPEYPGILFRQGDDRRTTDVVTLPGRAPVTYGNLQFAGNATRRWGYVAIKLPVTLPHMLLSARKSAVLRADIIPHGIRASQRLSLEGDFDRHFTLYCPRGYEQDALYLFAPDVMARFIDGAALFDVEIIGGWMLLYSRDAISTLSPDRWRWIVSVGDGMAETVTRWARWRDDRMQDAAPRTLTEYAAHPRGVAEPGRRLRVGAPWIAVAVGVAVVIASLAWGDLAG